MNAIAESDRLILSKSIIIVLKFMTVWPKNKRNSIYYFKMMWMLIFSNLVTVILIFYINYYYTNFGYNYEALADAMAGCASSLIVQTYLAYLINQQDKLHAILKELGDFSVYEKPAGIERINSRINLLYKFVLSWLIVSILSATLYTFTIDCPDDIVDDCGMLIDAYLPFLNIFRSPYRQMISAIEGVDALFLAVICFSTGYLVLSIAEYLVAWLEHLKTLVKQFPKMKKLERVKHVKKCILYHYKIIELADRFYEITYIFFMMLITFTSIIMTLILYQLIKKIDYINIVHVVLWFIYIIMCCLMGERLHGCSIDLADIVYNSIPWDGDLNTQKALLLMMIRAQRPICIPGGFEQYTSHALLVRMVKASYSFITLITNEN